MPQYEHEAGSTKTETAAADALQRLLDRAVREEQTVKGGLLLVESPRRILSWKGASGFADPDTGLAMLPDDQFRSASVAKMVLATTVMTLVEEGVVALDVGVGRFLPTEVTDGLHVLDGRSRGEDLTLRQLLGHTSGLADYFGDGEPGPYGPPFVGLMLADPDRLWDPAEVLAWTEENLPPLFAPGEGWHYSDTGYLVAGLVVENATGRRLHDVYRERIFTPLGMDRTYMTYREEPRTGAGGRGESLAYAGNLPYTRARSTSADWAGGGLTTTTEDLNRFMRAFVEDRIFRTPETRREMLEWKPTDERGVFYGLGTRRFVLDEVGMPGFGEVWGHTGALNVSMLYWPEEDATLVGTLNQQAAPGVWSEVRPVSVLVPETLRALKAHPA